MNEYSILIISPSGYAHSETFREVAEGLKEGLAELGHDVPITTTPTPGTKCIVLGANIDPSLVPDNAIIFDLEQPGSTWHSPPYLEALRTHETWSYDRRNIKFLETKGVEAKYCGIGYAPGLTRIEPVEQDVDVLFYGSIFGRRVEIMRKVYATGLRVQGLFGMYGAERDAWIARSKIVLNLHAYDHAPFEIVRCSYLSANRKFVLSEGPLYQPLKGGIRFVKPDQIANACKYYAAKAPLREAVASRGFEAFSSTRQSEYLRPLIMDQSGQFHP